MPKFFVAGSNIGAGTVFISGSDAEHLKVLRMKLGDRIIVCDGDGVDHHCRLTKLGAGAAEAEILESVACPAEPNVECTVLAGMPKGEKADLIVQKCTELGAARIVFFVCERCVSRPDGKSMDKKLQRWARIAEEAAKQSGRGKIPEVAAVMDIGEAFDIAVKTEMPLFMYETGERITLREAMGQNPGFRTAAIITGPEGGFEPYEAELAGRLGIRICSMGERILRCETAPLAALTAVMYESGNM